MSIEAMKYAFDVLENYVEDPRCETQRVAAVNLLHQAIAEAEKQEPDDLTIAYMAGYSKGKAAAQRQWVGLTEDEQDKVFKTFTRREAYQRNFLNRIASAIEAKLKEKNT